MSLATVIRELKNRAPDIDVIALTESGATVAEAAQSIGVNADSIAKTLALHLGNGIILIVMSGNARINNKKYRETFQTKAKMLSFEEVEPLTGHPVGGMCPFGLKNKAAVYLDESLRRHEFVYPAAGDRFHAFRISVQRLQEMTGAQWVDVSGQTG